MSPVEHSGDFADLVRRAKSLAESGRRRILGIAGAPGAGKGTVAEKLLSELGSSAVVCPWTASTSPGPSRRLGRQDRREPGHLRRRRVRGAAARLRDPDEHTVYARSSTARSRSPTPPRSGPAQVPLVITEGNYLLLDQGPWRRARAARQVVLAPPEDDREARLVQRHIDYGKPRAGAGVGAAQRRPQRRARRPDPGPRRPRHHRRSGVRRGSPLRTVVLAAR